MTPKDKAVELVNKFKNETDGIAGYNYDDVNVQCALIAVDVVLSTIVSTPTDYGASWTYWMQVKQEIENL
jgi:hypothetical protein